MKNKEKTMDALTHLSPVNVQRIAREVCATFRGRRCMIRIIYSTARYEVEINQSINIRKPTQDVENVDLIMQRTKKGLQRYHLRCIKHV